MLLMLSGVQKPAHKRELSLHSKIGWDNLSRETCIDFYY